MDDTSIAHMRESELLYFDTTWYKPIGFKQLLIGLYYDSITLEKYPDDFVIMNCKYQKKYENIFIYIKSILTQNNLLTLKIKYVTCDWEYALYNSVQIIFNKQHIICVFFIII